MKVKKIIAVVTMSAMLLSLTACGDVKESEQGDVKEATSTEVESVNSEDIVKEEIETAVSEFQYACQSLDVDAMLDCLDPGFAQALKSGRLLLNWMSTEENSDEIIMNAMVISIMNIADIAVDLSTMNIEIEETNIENGVATVEGTLTLESSSGTYRDKIVMRMSKDNNKWYITGVTT